VLRNDSIYSIRNNEIDRPRLKILSILLGEGEEDKIKHRSKFSRFLFFIYDSGPKMQKKNKCYRFFTVCLHFSVF
jgi:hypothetical protein